MNGTRHNLVVGLPMFRGKKCKFSCFPHVPNEICDPNAILPSLNITIEEKRNRDKVSIGSQ